MRKNFGKATFHQSGLRTLKAPGRHQPQQKRKQCPKNLPMRAPAYLLEEAIEQRLEEMMHFHYTQLKLCRHQLTRMDLGFPGNILFVVLFPFLFRTFHLFFCRFLPWKQVKKISLRLGVFPLAEGRLGVQLSYLERGRFRGGREILADAWARKRKITTVSAADSNP